MHSGGTHTRAALVLFFRSMRIALTATLCRSGFACGSTAPTFAGDTGKDATTSDGTVTTLYIHGRNPDGLPSDWSYWLSPRPGVNAVPVNWGGNERIAQTNIVVRDALDKYCSDNNWCCVACHSAGCIQVGYALDLFGATGNIDNWNILWVAAAGSAEGGSEVADLNLFNLGVPLDEDLKTTVVRGMYNHDNTGGINHWMFARAGLTDARPLLSVDTSVILPGSNDVVVAYHSSCGVNNTNYATTSAWCNATDSTCVDEGARSPFVLRDVQLWRMNESGYPDREMVKIWVGPYTTNKYVASAFSDRPWNSDSKQRHIEALQDAIARLPE